MIKFEVINELSLKITASGGETVYTKAGAYVGGQSFGGKNYKFTKMLLGPGGNPLQAGLKQLSRRFTGENLPLMQVDMSGPSETYYANEAQHVVVIPLRQGETLSVESENILAFTPDCNYSVRFLGVGVVSQKGLATSTLTGNGPNSLAAILVDGNPLVLSNMNDGSSLTCDPDASVAWIGSDPQIKFDLSWKNLLGSRGASGESYFFEWDRPATIIFQPNERKSGVDISMDGRRTGARPNEQQRMSMGQTFGDMGQSMNSLSGMLGNIGGMFGG